MQRLIWHIRTMLPTLFLGGMVCAVLAVAGFTAPERSDSGAASTTIAAIETKAELMAHLDKINGAACDPSGLYLFTDDAPLMLVWTASEPAELYNATGDFVDQLSAPELTRLIDTTRPFADRCPDREAYPLTSTAPQYYL